MTEYRTPPQFLAIDPLSDPRWDSFLQAYPDARIWYSSAWIETLQRSFGYAGGHLACVVDGKLTGLLPLLLIRSRATGRRLVSLPFSGPCGPIAAGEDVRDGLIKRATELVPELRCRYLDIRTGNGGARALQAFSTAQPYVWSIVPLQGTSEEVWKGLPGRVKTDIRRARRLGVTVTSSNERGDLEAFYRLFVKTTRKRGVPPQPYHAFDIMWDVMKPRGMLHLFTARLEKTMVNALLLLKFKDTSTALYIGTDYRFLTYQPVKLTYWKAMEWACETGSRVFDLGVTHVSDQGLRWFKRSLGAVESPVTYAYYPGSGPAGAMQRIFSDQTSGVGALLKATARQLPPGALQLLGHLLFKHMG